MNTNSGRSGRGASARFSLSFWMAGVGAAMALFGGCSKSGPSGAENAKTFANDPAASEKRYPLTGEVIRVDPERKVLVVMHDEIKGVMPAMTMEFGAAAGDLAVLKTGQLIRATMVAPAEGGFRLEKIWPNDKVAVDTISAGEKRLREDTHNKGKNPYSGDPADTAPNFVLYNQEGEVVQSSSFRGKKVMLNFIFTRCPDQTKCPAATAKMATVQRLAREAGVDNLELVSITLDAEYDTPGVLKEYAKNYSIDTANFSFLTGPESAIRDLLSQFGVAIERSDNLLKHTLATLLIDEHGKIVRRADGSLWEAKDFVASMKKQA